MNIIDTVKDKLNNIGSISIDTNQERAAKNLLLYLTLFMSFGGLVWGSLLLYFEILPPATIPYGYVIISFINILIFQHTKNFKIARAVQIIISMVLPFMLQWMLGGFVASGCVMIWSLLALIGSVILFRGNSVYSCLLLFIMLVITSFLFDSRFSTWKPEIFTPGISVIFLTINIILVSSIFFLLAKMKIDKDLIIQQEVERLYTQREKILANELIIRTQLQATENRYRNLVEESQVLICTHDLRGTLLTVNKPGAKKIDYLPEELIGKNLGSFLPPEFQGDYQFYLNHIAKHKTFESFMTVITRHGEKKVFLFRNNLIEEQGQEPYVLGSAQDVTEWRRSEFREQKIRNELQLIVSSMDDFVVEFDHEARFKNLWCRDESKLFMPAPSFLDKTIAEAFPHAPEFAAEAQRLYAEAIDSGEPRSIEIEDIFSSEPLYYLARFNPVKENGKYMRCTVLVSDITKRKQFEIALTAAKEEAENANRLKTIFLGNLSHEVRTPLQGIQGFAEILERPNIAESKRAEYLAIIKKRATDLQQIIESLLDMASLETGEIKSFPVKINLSEILKATFLSLQQDYLLKEKPVNLILENELPTNAFINIDPQHLKQVVINLIKNGIKFTSHGFVKLSIVEELNQYLVNISDSGIGIVPERVEYIFEPFRQAHEGLSRSKGGIGLGLFICKKLVQLWGGEIHVTSKPGEGSTFSFTIPKEIN